MKPYNVDDKLVSRKRFTIEQFEDFVKAGNIPQRTWDGSRGMMITPYKIPIELYSIAFQYFVNTNNSITRDFYRILSWTDDTASLYKKGKKYSRSDLQLYSYESIQLLEDLFTNHGFWNADYLIKYCTLGLVSKDNCLQFLRELRESLLYYDNLENEYDKKVKADKLIKIAKTKQSKIQTGFVYIVEGNGKFKIGISTKIKNRLISLQTSSPVPLTLIKSYHVIGYSLLEKKLHDKYSHKKLNGEWFNLSKDDLNTIDARLQEYLV